MNKAIENRATINLMLMRWEDAPRTVLVVEKSDKHMREGGIDGARLSNRAVVALEGLCRHCHEALHLNVVVEVRAAHDAEPAVRMQHGACIGSCCCSSSSSRRTAISTDRGKPTRQAEVPCAVTPRLPRDPKPEPDPELQQ